MNTTDLRLAFKMDTGDDPLWAKTIEGRDIYGTSWQRGWPRTIYGLWLEDQIGKTKYLRDRYFQVTSETPNKFFYGKPSGSRNYRMVNTKNDVLYGAYIEWLETFVLRFYKQIVTNIIKVN